VLLESGLPLGKPVEILRVCGTRAASAALTDAMGKFSFVITTGGGPTTSASEGGGTPDFGVQVGAGLSGFNRTSLWGCAIRAAYPGYISTSASLQGKDFSTPVDIGKIVLRKVGDDTAAESETTAKAPDAARKEFEKGLEDSSKNDHVSAERHLAKAVEIYPSFAIAWNLLGRNQRMLKQDKEAEKSFLAAIKADDKYVFPYMQLAGINAGWGAWPNVLVMTNKVIEIDPTGHPDAYFLNAFGHFNQKELPEAETNARKAVELDKTHQFPRAALLLGDVLKDKGDDKGAAEQYSNYLKLEPNSQQAGRLKDFIAKVGAQASAK
jgi:tetratricopeptide (TPR) repeat protein